jgi:hypothetical protein
MGDRDRLERLIGIAGMLTQPAFLVDFYRHMAVRYMFMAEDIVKDARADAARRATVARSRA